MKPVELDLLIFGGGIAGLWILLRARQAGFNTVLLETGALGGVQTPASQGIIHGGTKYALNGQLSDAARAIADMPKIWQRCLQGQGELDLSSVRLLSAHQYLWSTGALGSSIAGFLASKLMRSRVEPVSPATRPPPFNHPRFQGRLYQLNEPVLDVASLIRQLSKQAHPWCWKYQMSDLHIEQNQIRLGAVTFNPRKILLSAGQGNAELLGQWGHEQPAMQLRPLHMVMVKGRLPPVFAHCLGAGNTPRLTITSYPLPDGERIWYLGGQLAETGVQRSDPEQQHAAQEELRQLLPWMEWDAVQWASLHIQRAEVRMPGNQRPADCYLHEQGRLLTAWPTKLAFAPRLANQVLQRLGSPASPQTLPDFANILRKADTAELPWNKAIWN